MLLGQPTTSVAPAGVSGTLTLATPVSLLQLNLLDADGNGAASLTVKLNFADGSSDTISTTAAMQDWFNTNGATNSAIIAGGRANRTANTTENDGANPNLYEIDLSVPIIDQGELVQSVTFTQTGQAGGSTTTGIFALSGDVVPTASPIQYANNVSVTSSSTINVSNTLAASMGTLSIGTSALNVASANTSTDGYDLTLGATSLTGNPTFNVASSTGGGPGTLILGGAQRQQHRPHDHDRRPRRRGAEFRRRESRRRYGLQRQRRHAEFQRRWRRSATPRR